MRSACNMQRISKGQKRALILVEHILQGGKGSTVAMRALFVGNWRKDPRGNRFSSYYLSGQSLWENTAQENYITEKKQKYLCSHFQTDVMSHKKKRGLMS